MGMEESPKLDLLIYLFFYKILNTIDHWCAFLVLAHKFVGRAWVHLFFTKFLHIVCILYILVHPT